MFLKVNCFNAKNKKRKKKGQENSVVWRLNQRRTQKGIIGRMLKTAHNGSAKNPRLMKACPITRSDICEFFFISTEDESVYKTFRSANLDKNKTWLHRFFYLTL